MFVLLFLGSRHSTTTRPKALLLSRAFAPFRVALTRPARDGKLGSCVGVQRYCERQRCGSGLPFIVGADLTTWWDSDTTVFGEMMRIGLPLVGPHAATFYSRPNGQTPADAALQLDYMFASRPIAHRLTVQALNDPGDWGPSDHCRITIDLQEPHPPEQPGNEAVGAPG